MPGWFTLLVGCPSATDPPPAPADTPSDDSASSSDTAAAIDSDQDGFPSATDCDDLDPAVHPGAAERCNDGVDSDCDGSPLCGMEGLIDAGKLGFIAEEGSGFGAQLIDADDNGILDVWLSNQETFDASLYLGPLTAPHAADLVVTPIADYFYLAPVLPMASDLDGDGVHDLLGIGMPSLGESALFVLPADSRGAHAMVDGLAAPTELVRGGLVLPAADGRDVVAIAETDVAPGGRVSVLVAPVDTSTGAAVAELAQVRFLGTEESPSLGRALATGDLDGDQVADLVLTSVHHLYWISDPSALAGDVDVSTLPAAIDFGDRNPISPAIGDVDGGGADLVVNVFDPATRTNVLEVWLGPLDGTETAEDPDVRVDLDPSTTIAYPSVPDLDGDGLADLLVLEFPGTNPGTIRGVYAPFPAAARWSLLDEVDLAVVRPASAGGVGQVLVGDVTGDGRNDIVLTNGPTWIIPWPEPAGGSRPGRRR